MGRLVYSVRMHTKRHAQSMRRVHFANGTMYFGHYGRRQDPTRTRLARTQSKSKRARTARP